MLTMCVVLARSPSPNPILKLPAGTPINVIPSELLMLVPALIGPGTAGVTIGAGFDFAISDNDAHPKLQDTNTTKIK
jgi:hypothetical protein